VEGADLKRPASMRTLGGCIVPALGAGFKDRMIGDPVPVAWLTWDVFVVVDGSMLLVEVNAG
jgi:hypothetical protein